MRERERGRDGEGEGEREQRTPRRLFSGGTAPRPRVTPRCEISPCDPHRSLLVARPLVSSTAIRTSLVPPLVRPRPQRRSLLWISLFFRPDSGAEACDDGGGAVAAAAVEAGVATRLVLCMNKVRAGQGVRLGGEIVSVDRPEISYARGLQYLLFNVFLLTICYSDDICKLGCAR